MEKRNKIRISLIIFLFVSLIVVGYVVVGNKDVGKQCGGFAANLPEYQCSFGLRCVAEDKYPDAGGQCQYIWPISLLVSKTYPQQTNHPDTKTGNTETGTEGQFCGGFSNVSCPEGYTCKLEGTYPDAGGRCVKLF